MNEIKAYIHNYRSADVIHTLYEEGQCNIICVIQIGDSHE